ncbi:P2X receptor E-like isoform X1 [Acropora palmata]|uniref:P2X receptor E-like isoform X1 n=1 Tax=Acropora palmata TaxID=6131 RepID=UPI003DA1633C
MSFFHYITYKLVIIRDRRIGFIYYTIAVAIVLYTLAEIFLKKGYLELDTSPEATLRFVLSDPKEDNGGNESGQIPSFENLTYCCNRDVEPSKSCTPCQFLDAQELSWPVESHTISLTTFAKDRWQMRNTSFSSMSNPTQFETIKESLYFTARPESMLVKIEHAVLATKLFSGGTDLAASQRKMKGYLIGHDGKVLRSLSADENMNPRGRADRLPIQEILNAAGVASLDEVSDALNAKGKPFRRHGIVLHVTIHYQNTDSTILGTGDITYSYHVRRIPYADYRVNQLMPVRSEREFAADSNHRAHQENRLFRKRYGIKIEFHQSGRLGHFSFPALLMHLVSGVGLLTLTATIVDILTLYILPDRFRYRRFVYEESPVLEVKKNE